MIIGSPQNHSLCEGGTVEFTCVIMFPSGTTPGGALWVTDSGGNADPIPGHSISDDHNGRSAPTNVTTVLTVTNVRISSNVMGYICAFGIGMNSVASDVAILTVLGKYLFIVCMVECKNFTFVVIIMLLSQTVLCCVYY